jgi:glycosyltransferase involved in cell wall biosynthesis
MLTRNWTELTMYTALYPVNELKIGGAEQQLLELVRGLDKTRFRPIVAPLYPGGDLSPEFRAIPDVEVIDLHRRGKYDPSPLWRLGRLIRQRDVDIVQPFLTPSTFFGLLPAIVVGDSKIVVTERCGTRRVRGVGYRTYRTVEDALSRFADVIVSNSYAGQDMLLERGLPREKIRVIYNGINNDRLLPNPDHVAETRGRLNVPEHGAVIGILASLTPAKGHDTLLRAMARVMGQFPGLRLAIVGDGPRRPALEALAADLNLADRVVFFGYQRNVADFLATFDILVSASRDNEGCSNSVLEAMAVGVPVIATDVGGNRELVQHRESGYLVAPENDEELAQAIAEVMTARQEADCIVQRAKVAVTNHFGLERMVQEYEDLYMQLFGHERLVVPRAADLQDCMLPHDGSIEALTGSTR